MLCAVLGVCGCAGLLVRLIRTTAQSRKTLRSCVRYKRDQPWPWPLMVSKYMMQSEAAVQNLVLATYVPLTRASLGGGTTHNFPRALPTSLVDDGSSELGGCAHGDATVSRVSHALMSPCFPDPTAPGCAPVLRVDGDLSAGVDVST